MKKILLFLALFLFTVVTAQAKDISGTLQNLLKKGKHMRCTYVIKNKNQTYQGVLFTSDKKFRSEVKMPLNKKVTTVYSLSDGTTLYSWTKGTKQGTRMNLKKLTAIAKETGTSPDNKEIAKMNKDLQKEYKYKCAAWNSNASFFKAPKNIKFVDLTQMMEQLKNFGTKVQEGAKSACAICNSLPENVRQDCLAKCQ